MRPKAKYKFYELEDGALLETFKTDDDQDYFNFVLKYPLSMAAKGFDFEKGAFLGKEEFRGDLIQDIHAIRVKEDYLIIEGLKDKEGFNND
ncbi:hypothetical protein [Tuberibacillus sp. Marseille-P3662]|uniref:hypothetical protein n=1 Tax=Tuberibacillus sp. Marseille-P3662 TaxID=1965358 RepID=UPI000A1CAD08|nr:hypothetical protein [Tuberibacillus sp. Marseille-P3662]